MSIRFDATGDRAIRTATSPAFGDFTVLFWAYRVADQGDTETIFARANTGSGSAQGVYCDGSGGDKIGLVSSGPTFQGPGTGAAWTTGTWKRIAITFDDAGNSLKLYEGDADPATDLTNVQTVTDAGSFTVQSIGFPFHYLTGGTNFSGRIGNVKFYTAILSTARMKEELAYFTIQNATNIWGAWTCKTDTATITDQSGNGRDLTGTSLTTEADPPIPDSAGATGSLDVTLEALTAAATGTVEITGAVTTTLADVALSADGSVAIAGLLGMTLDALLLEADGGVGSPLPPPPITGALDVTLAALSLSASQTAWAYGDVLTLVAVAGRTDALAAVAGAAASLVHVEGS